MSKRRPSFAARVVALFALFALFAVTALRVSPVFAAFADRSTIEANNSNPHDEAIPTRDGELPSARAIRPLRNTDLSNTTRLRDVALGSLEQGNTVAFVADAATLGTRGSPLKTWTTSAPTRAELMVFLN